MLTLAAAYNGGTLTLRGGQYRGKSNGSPALNIYFHSLSINFRYDPVTTEGF